MTKVGKSEKRGGRAAGIPNKRTKEVIDRLKDLDCDPIEGMASIAREARYGAKPDLQLAGKMYKELAQYVAPKRKAVEISGSVSVDDLRDKTDQELEALINGSS